jgi:hypothetical protein
MNRNSFLTVLEPRKFKIKELGTSGYCTFLYYPTVKGERAKDHGKGGGRRREEREERKRERETNSLLC